MAKDPRHLVSALGVDFVLVEFLLLLLKSENCGIRIERAGEV